MGQRIGVAGGIWHGNKVFALTVLDQSSGGFKGFLIQIAVLIELQIIQIGDGGEEPDGVFNLIFGALEEAGVAAGTQIHGGQGESIAAVVSMLKTDAVLFHQQFRCGANQGNIVIVLLPELIQKRIQLVIASADIDTAPV